MKIINAGNLTATMQIVMQYAKEGSTTDWAKSNHGSYIELWRKLRQKIVYTPDPEGKEVIRSVDGTLKAQKADCEDFSILISAILLQKKIRHSFRIYDYGRGWEHIAVVLTDGTVIDPVNDVFNIEPEYVKKKDFYHKVNNGLGSLPTSSNENRFALDILVRLRNKEKLNKVSITKIASGFGIVNSSEIKELTEYAIILACREIVAAGYTYKDTFEDLVQFYKAQPNLSLRTSNSVLLQQYSTPSPIAYLMGIYCRINQNNITTFEPSAGNGLLTIASGDLSKVTVNEIDELRYRNLKRQGFNKIIQVDGSKSFEKDSAGRYTLIDKKFDAIVTNPPFGALDKKDRVTFDGYEIKDLDHLMAIRSLNVMADTGRAAIIIGGHTTWDELGRVTNGKNRTFLNYLYKHYNVDDIVLINGDLFSRMGTSFDIRLIFINGRKAKPEGFSPLKDDYSANIERTFESLFDRVMDIIEFDKKPMVMSNEAKYKIDDHVSYLSSGIKKNGIIYDVYESERMGQSGWFYSIRPEGSRIGQHGVFEGKIQGLVEKETNEPVLQLAETKKDKLDAKIEPFLKKRKEEEEGITIEKGMENKPKFKVGDEVKYLKYNNLKAYYLFGTVSDIKKYPRIKIDLSNYQNIYVTDEINQELQLPEILFPDETINFNGQLIKAENFSMETNMVKNRNKIPINNQSVPQPKFKVGDYVKLNNRTGKFGFTTDEGDFAKVIDVESINGQNKYSLLWADGENGSFKGEKDVYTLATKKDYENALKFHNDKNDAQPPQPKFKVGDEVYAYRQGKKLPALIMKVNFMKGEYIYDIKFVGYGYPISYQNDKGIEKRELIKMPKMTTQLQIKIAQAKYKYIQLKIKLALL